MKNVNKFFLGLIACVAIATPVDADAKPALAAKVKEFLARENKADSSGNRKITFDGFKPFSYNVGPSPSNQDEADDSFRYFQVHLPAGYHDRENAHQRYPVIYFFHGFGLNHSDYALLFAYILEDAPFIVVKIDASLDNGYLGSFYTNSSVNGNFEDYAADELPDYINKHYRTIKDPEANYLFGHSMGAYGAILLAIKYPHRFGFVLTFSPPPIIAVAPLAKKASFYEHVRHEIPQSGIDAGRILPMNGPHTYELFTWAAALSPNGHKPFSVDLPIKVDTNFIPVITGGMLTPDLDVIERWKLNDPFTLIKEHKKSLQNMNLLLEISKQDSMISKKASRKFHKRLNRFGIGHQFEVSSSLAFAQPPELFPYSPSNDIPLAMVYPTLEKTAQLLESAETKRPRLLVDLVVKALQTDPTDFSNISLANFAPFLDYCGMTPPATIGELLNNDHFRSCLSKNGLDPDEFIESYFEIAQLMNIDPFFFKIDQDGYYWSI